MFYNTKLSEKEQRIFGFKLRDLLIQQQCGQICFYLPLSLLAARLEACDENDDGDDDGGHDGGRRRYDDVVQLLVAPNTFGPNFPALVVRHVVRVDGDVLEGDDADDDAFLLKWKICYKRGWEVWSSG